MSIKDELHEMRQTLSTERDRLKLKSHLLKAELKEEWDEIEEKWQDFEARTSQKKRAAEETADDLAQATRTLGQDVKAAYQRFRKSL